MPSRLSRANHSGPVRCQNHKSDSSCFYSIRKRNHCVPMNSRSARSTSILLIPRRSMTRFRRSILSSAHELPSRFSTTQNSGMPIPLYAIESIKILMGVFPHFQFVRSRIRVHLSPSGNREKIRRTILLMSKVKLVKNR